MIELVVIFLGIVLIILASAIGKHINHRAKGSIPSDAEERLNERMDELDRRLTDIQDIIIAIDDKLERLEGRSPVKSPSSPQTISD